MESKKFTLKITCYGKHLSSIEDADENNIHSFIENYKEPLPVNNIKKALAEFHIGEIMYINDWHTNNSKLCTMDPKYHREIKLIRIK